MALADCFADGLIPIPEDEAEVDLCVTACFLSIEHAGVLRGAFASVAPNTGSAILRLQYEALLRGAWVLFAATPDQVRAGTPVRFDVTSVDVTHAFGLLDTDGHLVGSVQAMPGYHNDLDLTFHTPGVYRILCLEYCGLDHHVMQASFTVTP